MKDMESMIATSLSIIAIFLSVIALVKGGSAPTQPKILIYDSKSANTQVQPYIAAGQNPLEVIDAAAAEAIAQGFILVDSTVGIKGPESVGFVLQDFVVVGGNVGRLDAPQKPEINLENGALTLPGVSPQPSGAVAEAIAPSTPSYAPPETEILGMSPADTPALSGQH